ncbi:MAG: DUF2442 domain-containing protein [Stutzerimonas stutzeri]|nr:MAG: DUF2442 domain-containing protein [Stutzerimonas stutzeri]
MTAAQHSAAHAPGAALSTTADTMLDKALDRMREDLASEPRAVAAAYDAENARVSVDLANGCTFTIPLRLIPHLDEGTDAQRAAISIERLGYVLAWPELGAEVSLPDLMISRLAVRTHIARQAGQVRSAAKASAARANGSKGGRPRRAPV